MPEDFSWLEFNMAETVHARILRYLAEAHASEHYLEKVFREFADSATESQTVLTSLAERARSHQSQLEVMLEDRGTSVSKLRTGLAETMAFAPLHARMGKTVSEKASQRRIFAIAATAFQAAMYASLATAASVVREDKPAHLARLLLAEEQADLQALRVTSNVTAKISGEQPLMLVVAYLEDAIAAEHSFESQVKSFVKRAEQQPEAKAACALFTEHAKTTREHFEQLTRRLESLGAEPSILKGFFAEVFNSSPKMTGIGHDPNEQLAQDMITFFAIANAQVALFHELQQIAEAARDDTTAALASAIGQKNRGVLEKAWTEVEPAARVSIATMPYATSS
jgi:ferritin-like metal-binding protein YciE